VRLDTGASCHVDPTETGSHRSCEDVTVDDPRSVLAEVIRSRRTSMVCDRDREVPAEVIDRLCELATWAPNHKRTWPWRFAAFSGEGRLRLGETCCQDLIESGSTDEGKLAKVATKYARTPSVLVVGCAADDHPTFHDENRDAVAAGIQNLLLGATAEGLASFWSTAPVLDGPHTLELCGFEPGVRIIGMIYLGWSAGASTAAERPPVAVRHITR
jgi:nitroreductase